MSRGTAQSDVAVGVGVGFGSEAVGTTRRDACLPGFFGDASCPIVERRVDERLGDRGAVPGAFDEQRARVGRLYSELVFAVVEHEVIAERAGGELELVG